MNAPDDLARPTLCNNEGDALGARFGQRGSKAQRAVTSGVHWGHGPLGLLSSVGTPYPERCPGLSGCDALGNSLSGMIPEGLWGICLPAARAVLMALPAAHRPAKRDLLFELPAEYLRSAADAPQVSDRASASASLTGATSSRSPTEEIITSATVRPANGVAAAFTLRPRTHRPSFGRHYAGRHPGAAKNLARATFCAAETMAHRLICPHELASMPQPAQIKRER